MTDKENGAVALLKKYLQESDFTRDIITFHCLIHQESLCDQSIKITHVMDGIVKCVNKILSEGLKHRQFRAFLLEMNTQYKDLVHHSQVRWLSRWKVLQHFLSLFEEIEIFLQEKSSTLKTKNGEDVLTHLCDNTRLLDITLLTDITQHMYNLCIRMQRSIGNMIQFKTMSLFLEKKKTNLVSDLEKYAIMCGDLRQIFSKRFQDFNDRKAQTNLFQRPLSVDVEFIEDADAQLELLDSKSNQVLQDVFQQNAILEFYSRHEEANYPVLLRNSKVWIC
uniref:general transcription factor II-I repeat domain-containing protein 2-like n=1 Tax=Styela clava TaxID=7725 RepID=UPI001939CEAE|nr:general transcription factor II-I repeat domain-containing protein 2-like [Styela clava]